MRVLVANDIDENLFLRHDTRGWCQRIFWFVEPDDLVIVPEPADLAFIEHVGRVRGLDLTTVRTAIAPQGRYGTKMIDIRALAEPTSVAALRDLIHTDVTDVFLLFPSADTHRFTQALGGTIHVAGQEFFRLECSRFYGHRFKPRSR